MTRWYAFADFAERNACAEAREPGVCIYVNDDGQGKAVRQYWDGSWKRLAGPILSAPPPPALEEPPAEILPPPPRPPLPRPPVTAADIFLQPFDADSPCNTPLGKVRYGIPPSTLDPMVPHPVYMPGREGSRGRLVLVKTFRCGVTRQGRKYAHRVRLTDPMRQIEWHGREHGGGTGGGLPVTLRMPVPGPGCPYSDDPSGDNEVLLYPRNGEGELADVLAQCNYDSRRGTPGVASARTRRSYSLKGPAARNRFDDPGDWGPGAIDLRHPAGFLRGAMVDLSGGTPIRHLLNATATRHSRAGARPSQHVLGRGMAYPAWNTDRPLRAEDNLGDIPYGTIIALRWQDRGLRETLGLTPFGKVLFDTFLYFGCCLCDGQGQVVDDAPVLQLRVDWELTAEKEAAVEAALAKLLPHLWPVFDARRHDEDAPRHSDGLIYVGGGGPLGPGSINSAWDA